MAAAHSQAENDPAWLSDLVSRIGRGDRAAEGQFIARFEPGVRALARRHARPNDARAADVCQDVLMHVIERLRAGALKDPVALPAYLRTAVVHGIAALYRPAEVARAGVPILDDDALPASHDTPEKHATQQQLLRAVRRAMSELNIERDRTLLQRFYFEEHSKEQVCRELGIDGAHFRRVRFRARERLLQLLGDQTAWT